MNKADWLEGHWSGPRARPASEDEQIRGTGNRRPALATPRDVGAALARPPEAFDLNPKILRQLEAKKQMIDTGEGHRLGHRRSARLRHPADRTATASASPARTCSAAPSASATPCLIDQTNQNEYLPLNNIRERPGAESRSSTPCSRKSACSASNTATRYRTRGVLVLWEAQFGDFANGAQVIIDQFIASRRE